MQITVQYKQSSAKEVIYPIKYLFLQKTYI